MGDRKESFFTYTLSILASYWRASNWLPSGAEPAILFFQQLQKRKKKRFKKPSDLPAAVLYYYFPTSTTVTRAHSKISRNKKDVTNYKKTSNPNQLWYHCSGCLCAKKKLMKKSGKTTSELKAIEMQERGEFFCKNSMFHTLCVH